MIEYEFVFEATVENHAFGRSTYTVAYLPQSILKQLAKYKNRRLRIDGEVNGQRFHGAIHPAGEGRSYVLLSRKFLKAANLRLGDQTFVMFDVADQNAVDVPDELRHALECNRRAEETWNELTPGKRRSFAFRVSSAKRRETRFVRVEEVIGALVEGKEASIKSWH